MKETKYLIDMTVQFGESRTNDQGNSRKPHVCVCGFSKTQTGLETDTSPHDGYDGDVEAAVEAQGLVRVPLPVPVVEPDHELSATHTPPTTCAYPRSFFMQPW